MNAYWSAAWAQGATGWKAFEKTKPFADNMTAAATALQDHDLTFMGNLTKEESIRRVAFVPLCGDTFAMRALLDLGVADCTIGLDLASVAIDSAIAQFFSPKEEGLEVAMEQRQDCAVYRVTRQGALIAAYVVGDFFAKDVQDQVRLLALEARGSSPTTTNNGRFVDLIYDRASMVALPPQLRGDYVQFLISLITSTVPTTKNSKTNLPDGMVFLELVRRPADENQLLNGPPFHLLNEVVVGHYNEGTAKDGAHGEWNMIGPCTTIMPPAEGPPFHFMGYVVFRK